MRPYAISAHLKGTFLHWDGLAFVLYSMLLPFVAKVSLLSLGPAALIGAALFSTENSFRPNGATRMAGICYLASALLSFGSAFVLDKDELRVLQALGIDFWISSLPAIAYALWIRSATKALQSKPEEANAS